jgi:ABC-type transport system involved in multi-copper enzyme maturation permease subunit
MIAIWRSDLYRFGKSKLLYAIAAVTCCIALFLVFLMRLDFRLGISVFGKLTAFKGVHDIIGVGLTYQKGLGIFIAILIAVFIGQEYQWQTWQQKWMTSKNRVCIYLSKAALSAIASIAIFLLFQLIALLGSGRMRELMSLDYGSQMISGVFIYGALGTVICMLSMLFKSNTASIIGCLGFVLLGEMAASLARNISSFSDPAAKLVEWVIQHSIYGMSALASSVSFSSGLAPGIIFNSIAIMLVSTAIGLFLFRRYEL